MNFPRWLLVRRRGLSCCCQRYRHYRTFPVEPLRGFARPPASRGLPRQSQRMHRSLFPPIQKSRYYVCRSFFTTFSKCAVREEGTVPQTVPENGDRNDQFSSKRSFRICFCWPPTVLHRSETASTTFTAQTSHSIAMLTLLSHQIIVKFL